MGFWAPDELSVLQVLFVEPEVKPAEQFTDVDVPEITVEHKFGVVPVPALQELLLPVPVAAPLALHDEGVVFVLAVNVEHLVSSMPIVEQYNVDPELFDPEVEHAVEPEVS